MKYKERYKIPPNIDKNKVKILLKEIESQGCSCDLLYGIKCDIHSKIRELDRIINGGL